MIRVASIAVCFLLLSAPAFALIAVPKNFDQLVSEAELILVGTVEEKQGHRLSTGAIVTYITLGNIEAVKGDHSGVTYTLQVLGGTVGKEHFVIAGAPSFERGGTYLLFIKGNGTVMFPLVGVDHGKFHIRHDPNTGDKILYDAKGQVVVDIVGSDIVTGSPNTFATASKPPLSLTSVLETIRQRLTR